MHRAVDVAEPSMCPEVPLQAKSLAISEPIEKVRRRRFSASATTRSVSAAEVNASPIGSLNLTDASRTTQLE